MHLDEQRVSSPDVSIVIPVYNEGSIIRVAIVELFEKLRGFNWFFEVIVAENGSTDSTLRIIEEMEERYPSLRHISIPEPNYGRALKAGILKARGRYVICDEIDLCDVDFYRRALKILEDGEVDFVIGSKLHPDSEDRRPKGRHIATKIINGLLRLTLGFKGTDTHGLKAMRKSVLEPIVRCCVIDKDLFASELVIRAERGGVRIKEIPVIVSERRPPSIRLTRRVPNVLKNLVVLYWLIKIKG